MSILIKGLDMPTERESFNLTIKYNGVVLDTETGMQVAEACELPPHGRLIDAEDIPLHKFAGIKNEIDGKDGSALYRRGWNDALDAVYENAEIVIEEEDMSYNNIVERLEANSTNNDYSPYLRELLREAAASLANAETVIRVLSTESLSEEPFNNLSKPFKGEKHGEESGWHEFEPGKFLYDEMEANP